MEKNEYKIVEVVEEEKGAEAGEAVGEGGQGQGRVICKLNKM